MTENIANKVLETSKSIDIYCHSNEDNYMMELLASITKYGINNKYITYDELYVSNEEDLISKLKMSKDAKLLEYFDEFENITVDEIPSISLPKIKIRDLNPLVQGKRIKQKNISKNHLTFTNNCSIIIPKPKLKNGDGISEKNRKEY